MPGNYYATKVGCVGDRKNSHGPWGHFTVPPWNNSSSWFSGVSHEYCPLRKPNQHTVLYHFPFVFRSSVVIFPDQIMPAYYKLITSPGGPIDSPWSIFLRGNKQIIRNFEHTSLKPTLPCYLLCMMKFHMINHEILAGFCLFANEFWFGFRAVGSANTIRFENYSRVILMLPEDCSANPHGFLLPVRI